MGIIAGPLVTNGINPYSWEGNDEITKQLTRCVIAVQVCMSLPLLSLFLSPRACGLLEADLIPFWLKRTFLGDGRRD